MKKRSNTPFCRDFPYTKRFPRNYEVVNALIVNRNNTVRDAKVIYCDGRWITVDKKINKTYNNKHVVMWKSL